MTVKCREEVFALPEYITGKPVEEVERELGLTGACQLASNENPIGASPRATDAMRAALDSAHLYPESIARAITAPADKERLADGTVAAGSRDGMEAGR